VSVTGRVILGVGLVVILAVVLVVVQVRTTERLTAALDRLAAVDLPVNAETFIVAENRERLLEHLRKLEITGDPRYAEAAADAWCDLGERIERLRRLGGNLETSAAVARLVARARALPVGPCEPAETERRLRELVAADGAIALRAGLVELEPLVAAVHAASREGASRRVREAIREERRAWRTSLATLVLAAAGGALMVILTSAAIRRPLARLTDATRAVAAGELGHRIAIRGPTEMASLAASFNLMADRLEESDRVKRDFLSRISHELKTPLVAMSETNRLLLDEVPGPLTDKQRRLLELHLDGHRRLEDMLSNLLTLSRMEAGVFEYRFEVEDLVELVEAAVEQYQAFARTRRVTLEVDVAPELPHVTCDRARIVQVVQNLLSNAIRHTPEGGSVTVAVEAGSGGGARADGVRVAVTDTGAGVPPELRDTLFEGVRQGPSSAGGAAANVGLGLTICREIVTTHGGEIRLEESSGGGARFVFELPHRAVETFGGGRP
jgi:signal transduction histidine kinase